MDQVFINDYHIDPEVIQNLIDKTSQLPAFAEDLIKVQESLEGLTNLPSSVEELQTTVSSLSGFIELKDNISDLVNLIDKAEALIGLSEEVVNLRQDLTNLGNAANQAFANIYTKSEIDQIIANLDVGESVTKESIGLGSVDNTSDLDKPISTAVQLALDDKASITDLESKASLSSLTSVQESLTTQISTKAPKDSPTFTGTVSGVTKDHVGLSEVENTSDANKPISIATQTALDEKSNVLRTITTVSTTTYTLILTNSNCALLFTSGSAVTLTIPTNATVALPVGAQIELIQSGAGQVTVSPAVGVTLRSVDSKRKLSGQYAGATLIKTATDTWFLFGSLST